MNTEVSLDTQEFQRLIELFLSALRRRAGDDITKLAQEAALLARNARAQFVIEKKEPEEQSYLLGAWEMIDALGSRAAERHSGNARYEAARLPRARRLLMELGKRENGTATPSDLARALNEKSSNISALLRSLREENLVEDVPAEEAKSIDGRHGPVRITQIGIDLMDQLDPGWKKFGLLEEDEVDEELQPAVDAIKSVMGTYLVVQDLEPRSHETLWTVTSSDDNVETEVDEELHQVTLATPNSAAQVTYFGKKESLYAHRLRYFQHHGIGRGVAHGSDDTTSGRITAHGGKITYRKVHLKALREEPTESKSMSVGRSHPKVTNKQKTSRKAGTSAMKVAD